MITNDNSTNIYEFSEKFAIFEDNLNAFFLVVTGITVTLMQIGFACLEAGVVLSQNVHNIMLKNFLDTFVCCIVFWICGYSLAFSSGNYFVGLEWWTSYEMPSREWPRWFHQVTFASTASTVISGAVAERCNFKAYFFYSCIMSGIIYPIVCHWVYSDYGWLYKLGFIDFAGGAVIHSVAGASSLVAAALLGPRQGRFKYPEQFAERKLRSPSLIGAGGLLLLTGFIGFNGGSLGHVTEKNDGIILAQVMCNTVMGGAGGALLALFASRFGLVGKKSWNLMSTVNGGIAGMVSICSGCNIFTMAEALIVGIIGAIIFVILHHTVIALKIDDPLDAAPVHLGGGFWSPLSVPLVSNTGILLGWNNISRELSVSFLGAVCIVIWSLVTSFFLFGSLKLMGIFSVPKENELAPSRTSELNSNFVQIPKQPIQCYSNQGFNTDKADNSWAVLF